MNRSAFSAIVTAVAVVSGVACSPEQSSPTAGPTDLTVNIEGETFTLVDGTARKDGPPGSAGKNTVRVVGDPVAGDVSADGRADSGLLIAHDPGGSGTFYYAVVALADGGGYRATNVVPLGDRIEPRRIGFDDGRFVYEYLSRKPGEPLSATPSVPTTTVIDFDQESGQIGSRR